MPSMLSRRCSFFTRMARFSSGESSSACSDKYSSASRRFRIVFCTLRCSFSSLSERSFCLANFEPSICRLGSECRVPANGENDARKREESMRYIEIAGETVLRGKVKTPGSKNSSLALLSAACLAEEPVEISGVPMVRDVRIVADIMQEIGFRFDHAPDGTVTVARTGPVSGELDIKKSSSYRASYYFIGSLLARTGRVTLGYPGGDDFVSRPIDQHLKAFEAMGARVELFETHYTVTAERLVGADIFFDVVTSGATMNAMMAAVLAKGTTVLRNAAVDPEVVDTANFQHAR